MRPTWKAATAAVLISSAALALLAASGELAARRWVRSRGDPLARALPLLRLDEKLGWRQRENLSESLYGAEVRTNELGLRNPPLAAARAAARKIVVLGPSSTFGWGVPEPEVYARRLEAMLVRRFPRCPLVVVNAGEIGYSLPQGLRLYTTQGLAALRPDVLILAYGVNDLDNHRFFPGEDAPDEEFLKTGPPAWRVGLQRWTGRSYLFQVLQSWAASARGRVSCLPPGLPGRIPSVRVPPEAFGRLLAGFVDSARGDGTRVMVMTSAYHPAGHEAGKAPVGRSEDFYRLSLEHAGRGECGQAREAYETGRRLEPGRIQEGLSRYNDIVRSLAKAQRLPLLDAASLLELGGSTGLFTDPVHPSSPGHEVLARALFDRIVEQDLLRTGPEGTCAAPRP